MYARIRADTYSPRPPSVPTHDMLPFFSRTRVPHTPNSRVSSSWAHFVASFASTCCRLHDEICSCMACNKGMCSVRGWQSTEGQGSLQCAQHNFYCTLLRHTLRLLPYSQPPPPPPPGACLGTCPQACAPLGIRPRLPVPRPGGSGWCLHLPAHPSFLLSPAHSTQPCTCPQSSTSLHARPQTSTIQNSHKQHSTIQSSQLSKTLHNPSQLPTPVRNLPRIIHAKRYNVPHSPPQSSTPSTITHNPPQSSTIQYFYNPSQPSTIHRSTILHTPAMGESLHCARTARYF